MLDKAFSTKMKRSCNMHIHFGLKIEDNHLVESIKKKNFMLLDYFIKIFPIAMKIMLRTAINSAIRQPNR